MSMTESDFCLMAPYDFGETYNLFMKLREADRRERWEQMRYIIRPLATMLSKKDKRAETSRLFTFSWDSETEKTIKKAYSKEEDELEKAEARRLAAKMKF